ncbi:hypothetical protein F5884DRAFT_857704 [Xylogone sp. PMI_703]|nr:hypothetical protein F5884DRAFT_857704 [Xylogone sp. PMI_703]
MEDTSKEEQEGPIYFWKPHGSEYGFLSQWHESPFQDADKAITYSSAEQYMMYQKAVLFEDHEIGAKILETTSPREQKSLGRKVRNFDDDVWKKNRSRIVTGGSYCKFVYSLAEDEGLKQKLLATGKRELVEASPMDRIWGVGFGEKNAGSQRHRWGLNLLGKALMEARERIRKEDGVEQKAVKESKKRAHETDRVSAKKKARENRKGDHSSTSE